MSWFPAASFFFFLSFSSLLGPVQNSFYVQKEIMYNFRWLLQRTPLDETTGESRKANRKQQQIAYDSEGDMWLTANRQ